MRQSTALLPETQVRLNDLLFPHQRVHVHRTRLAFMRHEIMAGRSARIEESQQIQMTSSKKKGSGLA